MRLLLTKLSRHRFASALLAGLLAFSGLASARTWTSSDGSKTFDGELLSYNADTGAVSVELANGQKLNFKQEVLSAADIEFLKEKGTVTPAPKETPAASSSSSIVTKEITGGISKHDGKPADMTKPVQVFILLGQSNMVGAGKTAGLDAAVKQEKKYPYLADEAGNWIVRQDVRNVRVMASGEGPAQPFNNEWMTVTGNTIGPELGIGHPLGNAIDAPVMILKSCIGNRAISFDLLPPGAEGYAGNLEPPRKPKQGAGWYAGIQYDADVHAAQNVLADLKTYYPDATKYEVAGFFFWQGEKDCGKAEWADAYEKNLVQFIKALRKDFQSPNAKFVLATLGEHTKGCGNKVFDAHMAVDGMDGKYPEFKGNVATVYSNPLSLGGSGNGHDDGNAGTYMNVGEAMGKAMIELLK
ncbi:MAG: sialate O-acetylesterase [Verrucomicrobiota bacterium]